MVRTRDNREVVMSLREIAAGKVGGSLPPAHAAKAQSEIKVEIKND